MEEREILEAQERVRSVLEAPQACGRATTTLQQSFVKTKCAMPESNIRMSPRGFASGDHQNGHGNYLDSNDKNRQSCTCAIDTTFHVAIVSLHSCLKVLLQRL